MKSGENAKLAVTGASGFIGRGVLEAFSSQGISVRGISRGAAPAWINGSMQWASVRSYTNADEMHSALESVQFVLHLADNPQRDADRNGADAAAIAKALSDAASQASVQGIIFASSVYARMTEGSYGEGKRNAEKALLADGRIPTIILRLPPVYGKGGRGGLSTLAAVVGRGLPLPLGLAKEPRNYLSRRNFCDLAQHIVNSDSAAWQQANGRIFEPSDGKSISTRDLILDMGKVQNKPAKLLPFPIGLLRLAARLGRREALISGAIDRLDVESNKELTRIFSWTPSEQMPESLSFLKP